MNLDTKERVLAAHNLLTADSITLETFESLRTLLTGINPKIDDILTSCSKALANISKLEKGEIIELSAEALPEETEEEKKRKKAILFFIRSFKDLQSEVDRVQKEFSKDAKTNSEQGERAGRIMGGAKGTFGVVTIAAVLIVGVFIAINKTKGQPVSSPTVKGENIQASSSAKNTVQIIEFNGRKILLSQVYIGTGPDCDSPHYHAKDHTSARALDGTMVADPGACGFGKVKDVQVLEVEQ